jgi:hypothetical protein
MKFSVHTTHIHGTDVPVEEPSTASEGDVCAPKHGKQYITFSGEA